MSEPGPSSPLAIARGLLERAKVWITTLSRPARVLLFSTGGIGAVLVTYLLYSSSHETYASLFTSLEREDAAAVVAKLKEQKIPYRLGADGTSIDVPESRALELRLELASSGVLRGGGIGFESFDKLRLGATEFEQRVLYRRALEGELSRTFGTISAIKDARVHLVLPEKSVFVTRSEPASASIVVRLRPGRSLGPSEVTGIVHLAASSVAGLTVDRVALVTTEGAVLNKPRRPSGDNGGGGDLGDDERTTQTRALESALEDRARGMLERMVGPGHVDVRVTAELDLARVERVQDHYDSTKAALRSEEQTIERGGGDMGMPLAGVPGAESNVPLPTASAAPAGSAGAAPVLAAPPPGVTRESHTRNFEIDHVTEKRTSSGGAIRRLAVAVVVDAASKSEGGHMVSSPRSREELDKLTSLVKSAVGADAQRGDLVTVESVPFIEREDPAAAVATAASSPEAVLRAIPRNVKMVGGAVLGVTLIGAIAAVLRGRKKRRIERANEGPRLAPVVESPRLEAPASDIDPRQAASAQALADPATAALIIRAWLGKYEEKDSDAA